MFYVRSDIKILAFAVSEVEDAGTNLDFVIYLTASYRMRFIFLKGE